MMTFFEIVEGLVKLLVTLVFMTWVLTYGIVTYFSLTIPTPTKEQCGEGYVVVAGVNVMGWPGRWVCIPGKEPSK
jgi:hypothetical protein